MTPTASNIDLTIEEPLGSSIVFIYVKFFNECINYTPNNKKVNKKIEKRMKTL